MPSLHLMPTHTDSASMRKAYFEENVDDDPELNDVVEISLHVQISNDDAIKFYTKLGFEQGEIVENYYRRIDPPHCYKLYKKLR